MAEGTRTELDPTVEVRSSRGLSFVDEQRRILEAIATGTPLRDTLTRLVRAVEAEAPGLRASVLVLEGRRLWHIAAPSLPRGYVDAVDGVEIAPDVGSCAAAAALGERVIVEDTRTHPNWAPFRDLAATHGIRACWSSPVFGAHGEVLGTFALYHGEARGPRGYETHLVADATHLASIAIQNAALLQREAARLAEERKRAELRSLLMGAPVAIAIVDGPEFVFAFANTAYERLVRRHDLEGRRVVDVFPEIEDQGLVELLRSIYTTGTPYEFADLRVELDRGSGREEVWFTGRTEPYRDAEGRVRGLVSTSIEVTAHVKARRELDDRRAQINVQEKMSALGQLVSGVAHEIRTPLTYLATTLHHIQFRLERLATTLPPEQGEECRVLADQHIPSAIEGVERINHIVAELRGFTHLRADVREPSRLAEVVGQAVALFEVTHRGRVGVRFEPATDAMVSIDRLQVQQAVLNLLQNALESDPREPTIDVRVLEGQGVAIIEVADTGRGIPPAVRGRIFDPFFTTREGGTGLGLSIVKRVMDEHGGKVDLETSPQGTRFRLAFPLPGDGAKSP